MATHEKGHLASQLAEVSFVILDKMVKMHKKRGNIQKNMLNFYEERFLKQDKN